MATKNIIPRIDNEGKLGKSGQRWAQGNFVTGSFGEVSSSLVPDTNTTYDLGSATKQWNTINVGTISASGHISGSSTSTGSFGKLEVAGNSTLTGDITIGGNMTLGDADTDSLAITADLTSNLIPNADNTYNLGSDSKRWDSVYLSGSISASGGPHSIISATTIDLDAEGALTLDGGSITIGGDTDVAVDIDTTTLDIDASGAVTIDSTSTILISGDGGATFSDDTEALVYDGSGNVDFDTVALDIDSSGAVTIDSTAGVSIDAGAASNLSTSAGALTIHGAGGVNLGTTADVAFDIDTSTLDIDSSGAVTIDTSAGQISLNGATGINLTGGVTASGDFIPATTNAYDLGSSTQAWKELFVTTSSIKFVDNEGTVKQQIIATERGISFTSGSGAVADISGSIISGSALHIEGSGKITGDLTLGGNITVGDADTDAITLSADVTSNIIPNASDSYNLGSDSQRWDTLYLSGSISASGGPHTIAGNVTASNNLEVLGNVSSSLTSTGSFGRVSATDIDLSSIKGNWTNAGNTVADLGSITTVDINGGTINGITDLAVADGGTGVSTLTDGGVLLGSGTGAITVMDALADSEMIVGDGSTDPVAESGATLRTSIGVGTTDNVHFAHITGSIISASNKVVTDTVAANIARKGVTISGHLTSSNDISSSATITANQGTFTTATIGTLGGALDANSAAITNVNIDSGVITGITDLVVADGGTGVSTLTDGGVLLGSGTGAITAMSALGDSEMIVGDGSTDPVAESGATLRTSIGVGTTDNVHFAHITGSIISASSNIITDTLSANIARRGVTISGHVTSSNPISSSAEISAGTLKVNRYGVTVEAASVLNQDLTTDANVEFGTVTTTGNITAQGNIIAQNYIVSSSVTHMTSSAMSGSTVFGDSIVDTHQRTGSLYVTGSIDLIGPITATGNISASTLTIDGALPITEGGTGASTLTQNGVLIGNGTSAVTAVDLSTDGVIIIGDGSGNPTTLDVGGNGGITILGTIATGVWNGTAVASAYLDSDTAHLTTAQTFSGLKTFSAAVTASGHISASGNVITDTVAAAISRKGLQISGHVTTSNDISSSATITANQGTFTTATITGGTITGITDLAVADGGTGVGTLTDGGVLLGNGTDGIVAMAVLTDGQMLVGDGTTDPAVESGGTLRTSIGVGTTDNVHFAQITGSIISASSNIITDTLSQNVARKGLTISGHVTTSNNISSSATITANQGTFTTATITGGTITGLGTDLAVADGGTGASSFTDGYVLLGSGTGAITALDVTADGAMLVGDGTTDPSVESGATLRTSIGVGTTDNVHFAHITGSIISASSNIITDNLSQNIGRKGLTFTGHVTSSYNVSSSATITAGTVDINGGAIDGTAIGAASATTIKGTTIDATTDFTIDGLVITADTITNDAALSIVASSGDIILDPAGNNVLPGGDNADDLGAADTRWRNVYTTDLQLSNVDTGGNEVDGTEGNWTLQEGVDDIYMINNITNKRYKIALEEVD